MWVDSKESSPQKLCYCLEMKSEIWIWRNRGRREDLSQPSYFPGLVFELTVGKVEGRLLELGVGIKIQVGGGRLDKQDLWDTLMI